MAEKKILIVDYDKKSLDYLSGLFDSYEFNIIKATDGLSAYDKYKSEGPNLIILEAMLPKMHGFDLTKKISRETDGKLPIIIVTGLYRGPQYRNEALNFLGASDYFEKPVNEVQLVESVLKHLGVDVEIREKLPDPETVLGSLSGRIKAQPVKSINNRKSEEKKTSWAAEEMDDALSGIEVDVTEELSSLLRKKKNNQKWKESGGK